MKNGNKRSLYIGGFVTLLLILSLPAHAQPVTMITRPRLEMQEDRLIISYDIRNFSGEDEFRIWLEITNVSGNAINAGSVSGDIGQGIRGGDNKQIIWDIGRDGLELNEEIFVEVYAEKTNPPPADKQGPPAEEAGMPAESGSSAAGKTLTKTNMVLSSVILPGLGQSKVKKRKTALIMGIAGYGCILGSFSMNRQAIKTYDDYKLSMDRDERNSLYEKSVNLDKGSEVLANTAAAIWVANIVWVMLMPDPSRQLADRPGSRNFSIQPVYDRHLNSTMISLSYRF
jgi:hypothetical protein